MSKLSVAAVVSIVDRPQIAGINIFAKPACHTEPEHVEGIKDHIPSPSRRDAAGNATLGFEKILALSIGTPWRVDGLKAAAALTGLNVEFPPQPHNPDGLVHAFAGLGKERIEAKVDKGHPRLGSARAWLAHMDLLKYVIQSRASTALIVEDDVDFDVQVREQMRRFSDAIAANKGNGTADPNNAQSTEAGTNGTDRDSKMQEDAHDPYSSGDWDVLWLGHCGSYGGGTHRINRFDHATWPDDTTILPHLYRGPTHIPTGFRRIETTGTTICSYAYVVSRQGAARLVELVGEVGDEAFDIALTVACREEKLRCLTVTPEVFRHHEPTLTEPGSGSGKGSLVDAANAPDVQAVRGSLEASRAASKEPTAALDEARGAPTDSNKSEALDPSHSTPSIHEARSEDDLKASIPSPPRGSTANIMNSARCEALYHTLCLASELEKKGKDDPTTTDNEAV